MLNYILTGIPIALSILAMAITVLKSVAPKTANTTDDAVLARLEKLEAFIDQVLPYLPDAAKAAAAAAKAITP
jgi:hypothetical protein